MTRLVGALGQEPHFTSAQSPSLRRLHRTPQAQGYYQQQGDGPRTAPRPHSRWPPLSTRPCGPPRTGNGTPTTSQPPPLTRRRPARLRARAATPPPPSRAARCGTRVCAAAAPLGLPGAGQPLVWHHGQCCWWRGHAGAAHRSCACPPIVGASPVQAVPPVVPPPVPPKHSRFSQWYVLGFSAPLPTSMPAGGSGPLAATAAAAAPCARMPPGCHWHTAAAAAAHVPHLPLLAIH